MFFCYSPDGALAQPASAVQRDRSLEVGRYRHCRYRYVIDISDPKYRRYRYDILYCSVLWPIDLLYFIISSKVVNDVNVIP